jgi:hypothetical protein
VFTGLANLKIDIGITSRELEIGHKITIHIRLSVIIEVADMSLSRVPGDDELYIGG